MHGRYRLGSAVLLVLCLLDLPAVTVAQPAPSCTAIVAPGGALAAWSTPIDRSAASTARQLAASQIAVGQALHLALQPQNTLKFLLQPGKPEGRGAYAGLISLTIEKAGTYRVALGTAAWIDMVDDKSQSVISIAHTHGPACSGIHKMVDFALQPGHFTLQLSASIRPQTNVLIVRLP